MRDLALNMFWVNRFAMTHVREAADAVARRARAGARRLPAGGRRRGRTATARWPRSRGAYRALPAAWDADVEDRIFAMFFDVFGHRKHHATELPAIKPTVAQILADPAT